MQGVCQSDFPWVCLELDTADVAEVIDLAALHDFFRLRHLLLT